MKDGCVKSCIKNRFEYEYKNVCYHECPNNTYPLFCDNEDNINNSKECLEQTPQGYYLDINEKKNKKCYEYCKSCIREGNETYNNCEKCKDNLTFYKNPKNITNCYPKCNNYYYFNESNNFICIKESKCPDKYDKLIIDKKQCIDECQNDDKYKYEFNKQCYQKCPNNTINNETNSYKCIVRLLNFTKNIQNTVIVHFNISVSNIIQSENNFNIIVTF